MRVGAEVEAIAHLQEATVGNGLADDSKLGPIHVRVDRDNGGGGGCGVSQRLGARWNGGDFVCCALRSLQQSVARCE